MLCEKGPRCLLQTVLETFPLTRVTNPKPFPQIEFGAGFLAAVALEAPGIMKQSYPDVAVPKLPYPQQTDPY